jgi:hypothetical protein
MAYDLYAEKAADGSRERANFNATEMSRYGLAMHTLGMCQAAEHPDWPEAPRGATWDEVDAVTNPDDHPGVEPGPAAREYVRAGEAVRAWHPENPTGIACHKLGGTNDGWLVGPAEIAAALATYRTLPAKTVEEALAREGILDRSRWDALIDFITLAQDLGGYRVR